MPDTGGLPIGFGVWGGFAIGDGCSDPSDSAAVGSGSGAAAGARFLFRALYEEIVRKSIGDTDSRNLIKRFGSLHECFEARISVEDAEWSTPYAVWGYFQVDLIPNGFDSNLLYRQSFFVTLMLCAEEPICNSRSSTG